MNPELKAKVVKDIETSGFGSELKAIATFERREGWIAVTGASFFDPVLNVSRELDFTAHMHRFRRKSDVMLFILTASLVAEVKKSNVPWAVLRSRAWATPQLPFLMTAIVDATGDVTESEIREAFGESCVSAVNGWFGHGVREVFKKPSEPGRWFEAAAKTSRASLQLRQAAFPEAELASACYTQPVVILDGVLLEIGLHEDGNTAVEEIRFASVQFEEHSAGKANACVVDVVTLSALHAYLDNVETGFSRCFERLASRIVPK